MMTSGQALAKIIRASGILTLSR